jgi:membrane protease YdiL (CAAX protease family)
VLLAIVLEGGLGVSAVLLAWWLELPLAGRLRWSLADFLLGLAAAGPMLAGAADCIWAPFRPLRELMRVVDNLLVPLFRQCRPLELFVIAVFAGVGEEMLFRAVIQGSLASRLGPPHGVWIALGLTAVLFGAVHLITPAYGVLAGLMGLYLGWLWIVRGNLLVPVAAHAMYDFLALLYLAKSRSGAAAG